MRASSSRRRSLAITGDASMQRHNFASGASVRAPFANGGSTARGLLRASRPRCACYPPPWAPQRSTRCLPPPSPRPMGGPSTCRGFDRKKDGPRHPRHLAIDRDGGATGGDPSLRQRRDRPRQRGDGRRPTHDTPQHPATPRDTSRHGDPLAGGGATDRDGGTTGRDPSATAARQTATRPRHVGDIPRHIGDTRDTLTTCTC